MEERRLRRVRRRPQDASKDRSGDTCLQKRTDYPPETRLGQAR